MQYIQQNTIELCKLLKIADLVAGGGEAKVVISEGYVLLNGEVEYQKRKKVYHNDVVEFNGEVKLPVIGRIELKGKTIKEVEELLEEKYSKFYIKPFVQVRVTNKRVTVFPGGSSKAKIIPLTNNNMNLLEALGAVGGLTDLAKAKRIKLIRGNLKDPKVYLFDFSTIEGIQQADFVLQANDIVYIEPRTEYLQKVIRDIAPIISLVASTLTLFLVIDNLKNTN